MRQRSHPRRQRRTPAILGVIFLVLLGSLVVPAGSFSTVDITRSSTVAVVSDTEASHNLDVSPSVTIGQTSRLVTVTNNLGTDVTIEMQVRPDSIDSGDLVVDGVTVGDETSFSLLNGSSQTVDLTVPPNATLDGQQVYFHVNASAPGLTVTASDRSTTLTT